LTARVLTEVKPLREKIMTFRATDIPHDGYWRTAGQVFGYPLVTVFAASQAEADAIAGPVVPSDVQAVLMDSIEAQIRLGTFGHPDLAAKIMRGDRR
jgi:hypothetical protein